jgi:hypothetical protein
MINWPENIQCKYCKFFTWEVEENTGHPKIKVGRCSEFFNYVKENFGCKHFKQCFGIRCGGFPRVSGKLCFNK